MLWREERQKGGQCPSASHEPQGCLGPRPIQDGNLFPSHVSTPPAPSRPAPWILPLLLLPMPSLSCPEHTFTGHSEVTELPRGDDMLLPKLLTWSDGGCWGQGQECQADYTIQSVPTASLWHITEPREDRNCPHGASSLLAQLLGVWSIEQQHQHHQGAC